MTAPWAPSTPPGTRRPRDARVVDASAGAQPCRSTTGSPVTLVFPLYEALPRRAVVHKRTHDAASARQD